MRSKLPSIDVIFAEAVREHIGSGKFDKVLADRIGEDVQLLTGEQVSKMWNVPRSVVRRILTPVSFSEQTHRYRLSDVKAAVVNYTPKQKKK